MNRVIVNEAIVTTKVRIDPNKLKPEVAEALAELGIHVADPSLIHIDEQTTIVLNVKAKLNKPDPGDDDPQMNVRNLPTVAQLVAEELEPIRE